LARRAEGESPLSVDPQRGGREARSREDDVALAGSQPGGSVSEGRHEMTVGLVELPENPPARAWKNGAGDFFSVLGAA